MAGGSDEWIVVVEVAVAGPPTAASLQPLVDAMADLRPVAVCTSDRYALQVHLPRREPDGALVEALGRWRAAAEAAALGAETVVRAEAMTPSELLADADAVDAGRSPNSLVITLQGDMAVSAGAVPAVLSVLSGRELTGAARSAGMTPIQLARACDLFVEGGTMRLRGESATTHESHDRFFALLAAECHDHLGRLGEACHRLTEELGAEVAGACATMAESASSLRSKVEDLTEAMLASRRQLRVEPTEVDLRDLVAE